MKYIKSEYNLIEYVEHYNRCLDSLRNSEVEVDFRIMWGFAVMQTQLQALERSAASIYSRKEFFLFRSLLLKVSTVKVVASKEIAQR